MRRREGEEAGRVCILHIYSSTVEILKIKFENVKSRFVK
jgi:hypothetical protein